MIGDAEESLYDWRESKGIDYDKVDDKTKRMAECCYEDSVNSCLDHHKNNFLEDSTYIIEQKFRENPEWKLNNQNVKEE